MDAETDTTTQLPGPLSAAAVKTRAERRPATINVTAGTVSFGGTTYSIDGLAEIASKTIRWCALRGLASRLQASDDPAAEFARLKAGTIPSHGPAKPKEVDPWRKAYAHAYAEKQAKDGGVKSKSPEFATMLDEAMQRAAALDKTSMRNVRYNPAVVAHYNRITGNEAAL